MNKAVAAAVWLVLAVGLGGTEYNRAPGNYPGAPGENFSPILEPDPVTYRNLALHRPVFQSSAWDYNLTAQLVSDGIVESRLPRWISVATSRRGTLKKHQRERLFDENWVTEVELDGQGGVADEGAGSGAWIELELGGGDTALEADRLEVMGRAIGASTGPENWSCRALASEDGRSWRPLGTVSGMTRASGEFEAKLLFAAPGRIRRLRLEFGDPRARSWFIGEVALYWKERRLPLGGPGFFCSAWKSAGTGAEWLTVDLGSVSRLDRAVLHWLRRPAAGKLQASDDNRAWRDLASLPVAGNRDDLRLPPTEARYLRLAMDAAATADGCILSEFQVFGRGGLVPRPRSAPLPGPDGRLDLAGGSWRLQRAAQVAAAGERISRPGFPDSEWLPATVPGTVLAGFVGAGALAEPNFGDNQLLVSDSFFNADFWYRCQFTPPPASGRRTWLCFDGVNWKAEVWLNGRRLGRIEGAFTRGRFEVGHRLRPGRANALAVRVEPNAHPGCVKEKTFRSPGENGGILGLDSPTFSASVGWDWLPTVRGRNAGIWNSVHLDCSGPVTVEDPLLTSSLAQPGRDVADLALEAVLRNHEGAAVSGTLRGRIGEVAVEQRMTLKSGEIRSCRLTPATHPQLRLKNPRLWWPNGYGRPELYDVELAFVTDGGEVSDVCRFRAGIREFAYSLEGNALRIWINGRRFIPKGGNWGFPEALLRYRGREYEAAVAYHRDMHFNMIRNWVGQTGDDAFFEACDRHGLVVMQDFWLANPWDGLDPGDRALFLANAADWVRRIRRHPCIGLYCGRNEGYPPGPVDERLRRLLKELHPGIQYLASSADDAASGHGPYRAMPPAGYFADCLPVKFHTEMGRPCIPGPESVRAMMPESGLWPPGRMWGLHDFCLDGAQGGAAYLEMLERAYGPGRDLEEWLARARFLDYDGYRAMFEAQNVNRQGLLIWMSHPAWPSFVWQTYDYFLEPTAAYFGAKKACEPLHVQWNPASDRVEVVNAGAGDAGQVTVEAELLNLDGSRQWREQAVVASPEDSTVAASIRLSRPVSLSPVYFLRLRLGREGQTLSENLYLRGREEEDPQSLAELPAVALQAVVRAERDGGRWLLTAELFNPTPTPALMVQLQVVRGRSGDRVLPVLFSDNFLTLLPGERRTLEARFDDADTRGEEPRMRVGGFNVPPRLL